MIFRACERFGLDPFAFHALTRDRQLSLLGYERVREHEEQQQVALLASAACGKQLTDAL